MDQHIRVRFAPSPTGYMHVGGARTALFNYLFAKHHGGVFILRIEDTDQKRYQEDALQEIYSSLQWLGLQWDEGPLVGGPFGPYAQSQRTEIYQNLSGQLLKSGQAYRCFCTPERLAQVRDEQQKKNLQEGSGYDRHCRVYSPAQSEEMASAGKPFTIRLKVPLNRTVAFHDLIRGTIEYQSDLLDDLVLLKSDGFPTYHLANVIDDHRMEISHVLRGDEWIASTPKHILLYESFGWSPPQFAHMPVILSPDGGKLSKRKGAASVMDYKNAGYLPETLRNFLALLGWSPGEDRELMSLEEMIAGFSLERITPKAAVFDEQKLEWMNGHYLQQSPTERLVKESIERWKFNKVFSPENPPPASYLSQVVELFKGRAKHLHDIADQSAYFFVDPVEYEAKAAEKNFRPELLAALKEISDRFRHLSDFSPSAVESLFRSFAEEKQIPVAKLIHAARLAVSGVSFGPGLFEMLAVLGKETVIRRLQTIQLGSNP